MLLRLVACSSILLAAVCAAEPPAPTPVKAKSKSQERVCETIILTGSRLAAKKFCGTRAEWADRRQQDKDVVNQIQTRLNGPCSTIQQHSGTPSC